MNIAIGIGIGLGPFLEGGGAGPSSQFELISGPDFFLISGVAFDLI